MLQLFFQGNVCQFEGHLFEYKGRINVIEPGRHFAIIFICIMFEAMTLIPSHPRMTK